MSYGSSGRGGGGSQNQQQYNQSSQPPPVAGTGSINNPRQTAIYNNNLNRPGYDHPQQSMNYPHQPHQGKTNDWEAFFAQAEKQLPPSTTAGIGSSSVRHQHPQQESSVNNLKQSLAQTLQGQQQHNQYPTRHQQLHQQSHQQQPAHMHSMPMNRHHANNQSQYQNQQHQQQPEPHTYNLASGNQTNSLDSPRLHPLLAAVTGNAAAAPGVGGGGGPNYPRNHPQQLPPPSTSMRSNGSSGYYPPPDGQSLQRSTATTAEGYPPVAAVAHGTPYRQSIPPAAAGAISAPQQQHQHQMHQQRNIGNYSQQQQQPPPQQQMLRGPAYSPQYDNTIPPNQQRQREPHLQHQQPHPEYQQPHSQLSHPSAPHSQPSAYQPPSASTSLPAQSHHPPSQYQPSSHIHPHTSYPGQSVPQQQSYSQQSQSYHRDSSLPASPPSRSAQPYFQPQPQPQPHQQQHLPVAVTQQSNSAYIPHNHLQQQQQQQQQHQSQPSRPMVPSPRWSREMMDPLAPPPSSSIAKDSFSSSSSSSSSSSYQRGDRETNYTSFSSSSTSNRREVPAADASLSKYGPALTTTTNNNNNSGVQAAVTREEYRHRDRRDESYEGDRYMEDSSRQMHKRVRRDSNEDTAKHARTADGASSFSSSSSSSSQMHQHSFKPPRSRSPSVSNNSIATNNSYHLDHQKKASRLRNVSSAGSNQQPIRYAYQPVTDLVQDYHLPAMSHLTRRTHIHTTDLYTFFPRMYVPADFVDVRLDTNALSELVEGPKSSTHTESLSTSSSNSNANIDIDMAVADGKNARANTLFDKLLAPVAVRIESTPAALAPLPSAAPLAEPEVAAVPVAAAVAAAVPPDVAATSSATVDTPTTIPTSTPATVVSTTAAEMLSDVAGAVDAPVVVVDDDMKNSGDDATAVTAEDAIPTSATASVGVDTAEAAVKPEVDANPSVVPAANMEEKAEVKEDAKADEPESSDMMDTTTTTTTTATTVGAEPPLCRLSTLSSDILDTPRFTNVVDSHTGRSFKFQVKVLVCCGLKHSTKERIDRNLPQKLRFLCGHRKGKFTLLGAPWCEELDGGNPMLERIQSTTTTTTSAAAAAAATAGVGVGGDVLCNAGDDACEGLRQTARRALRSLSLLPCDARRELTKLGDICYERPKEVINGKDYPQQTEITTLFLYHVDAAAVILPHSTNNTQEDASSVNGLRVHPQVGSGAFDAYWQAFERRVLGTDVVYPLHSSYDDACETSPSGTTTTNAAVAASADETKCANPNLIKPQIETAALDTNTGLSPSAAAASTSAAGTVNAPLLLLCPMPVPPECLTSPQRKSEAMALRMVPLQTLLDYSADDRSERLFECSMAAEMLMSLLTIHFANIVTDFLISEQPHLNHLCAPSIVKAVRTLREMGAADRAKRELGNAQPQHAAATNHSDDVKAESERPGATADAGNGAGNVAAGSTVAGSAVAGNVGVGGAEGGGGGGDEEDGGSTTMVVEQADSNVVQHQHSSCLARALVDDCAGEEEACIAHNHNVAEGVNSTTVVVAAQQQPNGTTLSQEVAESKEEDVNAASCASVGEEVVDDATAPPVLKVDYQLDFTPSDVATIAMQEEEAQQVPAANVVVSTNERDKEDARVWRRQFVSACRWFDTREEYALGSTSLEAILLASTRRLGRADMSDCVDAVVGDTRRLRYETYV